MFGEGRHSNIDQIFEQRLAPFMTQASYKFWEPRLWYFKQGLYYQGGMVCPSAHPPPPPLQGIQLNVALLTLALLISVAMLTGICV